jgi:hypothetical protein
MVKEKSRRVVGDLLIKGRYIIPQWAVSEHPFGKVNHLLNPDINRKCPFLFSRICLIPPDESHPRNPGNFPMFVFLKK